MNTNNSAEGPRETALFDYARNGLWALPVWAGLLLIGTWTHQPDPDTNFAGYAEYVTTTWFLVSHLVASILGAAIGVLGLFALYVILSRSRSLRIATIGLITAVIGNTLVTSVFGVAAFAQPAIGNAYLDGLTSEAIAFDDDVYGSALYATALPGLLMLTVGLVLFGLAVARSGVLPRGAGYAFAVAGVLFALIGFAVGFIQTIGAAVLIASSIWIAVANRKQVTASLEHQTIEGGAPTGS